MSVMISNTYRRVMVCYTYKRVMISHTLIIMMISHTLLSLHSWSKPCQVTIVASLYSASAFLHLSGQILRACPALCSGHPTQHSLQ